MHKSIILKLYEILSNFKKVIKKRLIRRFGGDDGARTHDPLNAIQVLSQTELHPRTIYILTFNFKMSSEI